MCSNISCYLYKYWKLAKGDSGKESKGFSVAGAYDGACFKNEF